jgi:hypothetical protein
VWQAARPARTAGVAPFTRRSDKSMASSRRGFVTKDHSEMSRGSPSGPVPGPSTAVSVVAAASRSAAWSGTRRCDATMNS